MELSVLAELINSVGFPIAMVGVFGWYINKRDNQRIEIEKETKAQEIEERKKLIITIEENRITNQELLATNKELSETNRLLCSEINRRMNLIENTLLEINQKVS